MMTPNQGQTAVSGTVKFTRTDRLAPKNDNSRVSLAPLDPKDALRALLRTHPKG